MTDPNKFTQQGEPNYELEQQTEKISGDAQEKVEEERQRAQEVADTTPKSPEEMLNNPDVVAPKTKKKAAEKKAAASAGGGKEKFEVDLDRYCEFVDRVTSPASKNYVSYIERLQELHKAGCNIERLDTAAAGICAEGGEFMEIVKKLKFQGKPWDQANKEHLQKELGDVMWYVANAAMALDMRLDEIIYINTLKLAARYPEGMFDVNYSENRAPGDI
jgi:NTP pyrophosphatase (non-canonical NTP hydrolase)